VPAAAVRAKESIMVRCVSSAGLGLFLFTACATTQPPAAGITHTTSGSPLCRTENATCLVHADCCSSRCDNGLCAHQEP
jgi:hypothetical protein